MPYGLGRFVGRAELAGVFHDVLHEAVALEDVVNNPEFFRLFKGERIPGDHQFDRFAFAHHPRQPLRAAGSGKHTQIYFR